MLCWLLYAAYPIFSGFIMLLWIYPILASRFAIRFFTILGKKRGPKGYNHWRKTEIEASLDLILIWWKERELLQRKRGKRRSEKCQFGPRETEPSSHVQPNAVSSCLTQSLSTSPTRRGLILSHAVPFYQPHATRLHTTRPHTSARNSQLNGNPPIRAPCEGFRQGLGENWGKTKELGKIEYN
jgi:hypothetical protein